MDLALYPQDPVLLDATPGGAKMTLAPIQGKCPVCHQDSANTAFQAGAASRDAEIAELVADAARYRFLRKFLSSKDLPILTGRGERNEPDEQYAMDCVVDVAIAKVRKP